ncbi:alpha/beta fold hydrolase [Rhizobium sp. C4]|uniref:alpha/beta fold hydrolase n=1 Tax=Rhizobium sp. C4 TaxID=1349800 RepID=UPI001E2CD97C|nr:alpha/beta hydrolase [Rhizobium sp. C4]MCD2175962.1 alpha/beta hydrolase [Rhizobium sp. C4]
MLAPRLILAVLLASAPIAFTVVRPAMATAETTASIHERTASVGSQRFRYLEAGTGETLIVLLHGWPEDASEWHKVMPRLAMRYRVVAVDLPGVGGSTSPSRDFSKAAMARELHDFVKGLDARHVVLVGHDIGGMVTYAYARQFPEEVQGAAILDVPLPGLAPWDKVETIPQAWHFQFNAQAPLAEQLVAGRQTRYFRYFIDKNASSPTAIRDADVAGYAAAYGSADQLSAGFGFYRSFPQDKLFNDGQRGNLPVPLLVAGADRSLGAGADVLAQALRDHGASDVRSVIIDGSGHWVAEERPDDIARLIELFVTTIDKLR